MKIEKGEDYIMALWPVAGCIRVDAMARQVVIHRTSVLFRSVEQIPASAITLVEVVEETDSESEVKRYPVVLKLEGGKRYLTTCPSLTHNCRVAVRQLEFSTRNTPHSRPGSNDRAA
ncbi:MAG TPA: hypothetical protein VH678_22960 [Xanthobacteraceae bacterium]